jgi:nitroreductase
MLSPNTEGRTDVRLQRSPIMIALNPNTKLTTESDVAQSARGENAVVSPTDLISALTWRYAVKQYDPSRSIAEAAWNALEEALVLTPSGIGLQPWAFFVVDDKDTRARLREASYGQPQITDAAKLVVFAARTGYSEADVDRYVRRIAEVRQIPIEALAGLKNAAMSVVARPETLRDEWAARQTYIALGTFVTSAAALGIDATPMEGLDPARYDEILGLTAKGYHTLAVAAAGHRSQGDKYAHMAKVRFAREEVVKHV